MKEEIKNRSFYFPIGVILEVTLGPGVNSASNRNEYRKLPGDKT
jgi:hypothetical protein